MPRADCSPLAVCVLAAASTRACQRMHWTMLGRLLQGLLVLWAYLDFMQLLIIWQVRPAARGGLVRGARSHGLGRSMAAIVALGHFLLPFFALMSPRLRRRAPAWSPLPRC